MKHSFSCIIALTGLIFCLSSCHTSAPRLDYKALAQASVRLGVDIELQDNHKLYIFPRKKRQLTAEARERQIERLTLARQKKTTK